VDGGRREVFAGVCAQVEEDEEIDEDGAEHEDEDPKVVKPETLGLIGVVYPALEGLSVMDSGVKKGERKRKPSMAVTTEGPAERQSLLSFPTRGEKLVKELKQITPR
jgi:hypothetical protein